MPLLTLALLYFALRYFAAEDLYARSCCIVTSLFLMLMATVRYFRRTERFNRILLAICAAVLVVTYVGRWLEIPPFSGWRDAILFSQVLVAAVLLFLSRKERRTEETLSRKTRVILIILSALGPALFHTANNVSFLPGAMILPYLLLFVVFGRR